MAMVFEGSSFRLRSKATTAPTRSCSTMRLTPRLNIADPNPGCNFSVEGQGSGVANGESVVS